MKKYSVNGKTKRVSPENEQAFLEECRQKNITPVLISDEPGKDQGASQPQQKETDPSLEKQTKSTESKSEDGSSDLPKKTKDENEGTFLADVGPSPTEALFGADPLEFKLDDKGRRLYFDPRANDFKREVKYDYDRSEGIRFDEDSYGETLDNFANNVIKQFVDNVIDFVDYVQSCE